MARSPRGKRPPRPSVVVTFAATASLLACGGHVDTFANGTNDGGSETNGADCPTTQPGYGESCDGALTCHYPNGCVGADPTEVQCQSGKWVVTSQSSCNPPPPACPTTRPEIGSSCLPGSYCSYTDTCADRPLYTPSAEDGVDRLACNSGKWSLADPYVPTCPKTTPTDGASCLCGIHPYPATCTYATGCSFGVGDAIATCDSTTQTWHVMHATCNPPAPDGGPIDVGVSDVGSFEVSPSDAGHAP